MKPKNAMTDNTEEAAASPPEPRVELPEVGDGLTAFNAAWTFGGSVAERFDEHVAKSVPMYREGHQRILEVSDYFVGRDSTCYDLGCSTATLVASLASRHPSARVIGLDCELDMVRRGAHVSEEFPNVEIRHADVAVEPLESSSFVVAYYTLQFIHPSARGTLIERVYDSLAPGSAFLCYEKVLAPDARLQDIASQLYSSYKMSQGYSADELVAKARSIRGVLRPFTESEYECIFKSVGFSSVMVLQKDVCFQGWLCIK